jgi:NTP pyrophosphatase (non-canonical NTP hydrolase)
MKTDIILQSIKKLLEIGKPFFKRDSWLGSDDISDIYFDGIFDEVQEARDEFKKDNVVKLEDELGDIFWNYIMLLQTLERKGYIRSIENVFTHAEEKFIERLGFIYLDKKVNSSVYWDTVKKKQKKRIEEEHAELYGIHR